MNKCIDKVKDTEQNTLEIINNSILCSVRNLKRERASPNS